MPRSLRYKKTFVTPWISTHNASKNILCCNGRAYGLWLISLVDHLKREEENGYQVTPKGNTILHVAALFGQ
ncbi:hypothetical protein H5410_038712 [Solanum commersonii]|uniref:Uncharacterized protein n=1 Tax=Solanum commersonii TaxID=4109 RepID=A0A9J5YD29_SOLCO|nr:hypothetical protein H5410_038712 [Solanum commersonii]